MTKEKKKYHRLKFFEYEQQQQKERKKGEKNIVRGRRMLNIEREMIHAEGILEQLIFPLEG